MGNDCWDLTPAGCTPSPAPPTTTEKDMGCSNWETAKIGNLLTFATEQECTAQCAANSACVYSNYQTEECGTGDNSAHKGACYLFSSCTKEINKCWDLTGPPTATTTTTNCCVESTMRTAYEKGFNVVTLIDCTATTSADGQ